MKISQVIQNLKKKPQHRDVEFLVIDKETHEIVSMSLSDDTVDVVKLMRSFKPVKAIKS